MKKATVEAIVKGKSSDAEWERFALQARTAQNQVYTLHRTLTTTATGVLTSVWVSDPLEELEHAHVYAQVTASSADGTIYATYMKDAQFFRPDGGVAMQQGTTVDRMTPRESHAALDCTLSLVGNAVALQVNDGGVGTVSWNAWLEVRGV